MLDYYYSLTPRQFLNTLNGRRKREDALSKERWILARKVAYWSVVSNLKNAVGEMNFMPYPWEENLIKEMSEAEIATIVEDAEKVAKYWDDYDEKQEAKKAQIVTDK